MFFKGGIKMDKILIIGVVLLILVFGVCNLQNETQISISEPDFIMVNKLIKCDWSNMGSWIYLYDPSIEELSKSALIIISFDRELEGMGSGGKDSSITQSFINLVNEQYEQNNLLLKYSHKNGKVVLIYQNGLQIIWEYANIKEPTVLLN